MSRDTDNQHRDGTENTDGDAETSEKDHTGNSVDALRDSLSDVEIAGATAVSKNGDSDPGNKVECTECGEMFKTEHGMKTHRGKAHSGWDDDQVAGVNNGDGPDEDSQQPVVDTDAMDSLGDPEEVMDEFVRAHRESRQWWDDAREAFEDASRSSSNTNRRDALAYVVKALSEETQWMSVARRSQESSFDLWYWTGEGWNEEGHAHVRERMVTELSTDAGKTAVNRVVMQLATLNPVREEELNAGDTDDTLIPVANGVINLDSISYDPTSGEIDWEDVELQEMDSDYHFTYRVQTEWDPEGADVEGLDTWLETITQHEEARRIIWEFAGHSIHPGYPVDGFLVLLGDGGSGKSQVLKLIKEMLGEENTSARSITDLETNRFAGTDVVDSRANINTELQGTKLPSIALLKTYSAGEEVSVEEKMKPAYNSKNNATMLFASDDPPAFPTRNNALGRRLYPVEFPCSYVENPDPSNPYELQHRPKLEVEAELQAEARCKAALLRAVEGLVRLLDDGEFSSQKSRIERVQQYESYADPIHDFSRVCLESVSDDSAMIEASVLKGTFDRFVDAKGHDGKSMQQIAKVLEKAPGITFGKRRIRTFADDQAKHTVYSELRFTEEALANFVPETADRSKLDTSNAPEEDDVGATNDVPEVGDGPRVTLADLADMPEGTKHGKAVGVTVEADHDPQYQREAAGELTDGTQPMEYFSRTDKHRLEEGESYIIESPAVVKEHGDPVLKLRAAATTVYNLPAKGTAIDDFGESTGSLDANGASDREESSATVEGGDDECEREDSASDTKQSIEDEDVRAVLKEALDELFGRDDPGGAAKDAVFDLVAERTGANDATIDRVLKNLELEGEVYEYQEGYFRTT